MAANTHWIVKTSLARFAVPIAPPLERLMRRLPLISLLGSFSVTSLFYISIFDVDNMGRSIYFEIIAASATLSILVNLAIAQFFSIKNANYEDILKKPNADINWRPGELLTLTLLIFSLLLIRFIK